MSTSQPFSSLLLHSARPHVDQCTVRTNSKATLKVDLDRLDRFLPDLLHNPVRDSRYCARKSHALVISSDDSRSQADNRRSCQVKLYNEIVELAKKQVPGQTSTAQKQRVQNL